jgi:hypothetical protein
MIHQVLLILAALSFALVVLDVHVSHANFLALGLMFLALSMLVTTV